VRLRLRHAHFTKPGKAHRKSPAVSPAGLCAHLPEVKLVRPEIIDSIDETEPNRDRV
jgi:hypothetical protein